ncbi:MAG: Xaa-Pro dipeptidyl-peptidase [Mycobacteriales bacterium]
MPRLLRRFRPVGVLIAVLTPVLALAGPAASADPAARHRPAPPPYVRGGQTVPTYSYADAVRESVWVTTSLDNDGDGKPDRIAADIVRPREAAAAGVKVPVVMEASPYYQCCGRGNESEVKAYDAAGNVTKTPLFYDNYFVPRGYAFVAVDLAGTSRSTGCADVGGPEEVQGARAVVDWLNGRASATHADGSPAVATTWTTGKVGIIGKSWDGTMANGVASTGVRGLVTIVPIAGISSWYDYERFNGVLRSDDYPAFLNGFVNGRPDGVCDATVAGMRADSAESTGDFNGFWAARDYRLDASRVRASVFVVHGINDVNVTTNQFATWWGQLAARGVPRKIWLAQESHVDPFDYRRPVWVDTLHQWFDYWLQGLHNHVMDQPRASIEQAPGQWVDQPDWPAVGTRPVSVRLGNGDGTTGRLGGAPGTAVRTYTDDPNLTEDVVTANPGTALPGRVAFLSAPLARPLRISGTPSVTLRVKVDRPTTELTARLVDYGAADRVNYLGPGEGITTLGTQSCWGESTAADDACYFDTAEDVVHSDHAVLTRGWLDAAHHVTLARTTPLQPGTWYTVTVPLDAYDALIPAGHTLGLILTQSDNEYTTPRPTGATVQLALAGSALHLPVAGPLAFTATTPGLITTTPANPRPLTTPTRTRPTFR